MNVATEPTMTMRMNSKLAVRSLFSVRLKPSITPPCEELQYSSMRLSPACPHQCPLIQSSLGISGSAPASTVDAQSARDVKQLSRRSFMKAPPFGMPIGNSVDTGCSPILNKSAEIGADRGLP